MEIELRNERFSDYPETENVVREAFWNRYSILVSGTAWPLRHPCHGSAWNDRAGLPPSPSPYPG